MHWSLDVCTRWLELGLTPFDRLAEGWALTALSVLTGAALLILVRFTTPQQKVERARDRMMSAVYETRLFLDDPRRLLVAQARLFGWGLAYVASVLPALVLMALPGLVLYRHLDARFGHEPLPVRTPIVLEVDLSEGTNPSAVELSVPQGVDVTAPIRVETPRKVFFRVEIARPSSYEARFKIGTDAVGKRLVAARGQPTSAERARSERHLFASTTEPPLPDHGPFERLMVFHEPRADGWLGMRWWAYWMLVATVSALVLRKPFGVNL
jgi:hypothetical protein